MAQLRGKVVILDFWTYGCVNCMHVLRDLKTLEQRFPDELVVDRRALAEVHEREGLPRT